MALTLNKIGITTGNTVEAYHVTQSIDAFTGLESYDINLSGSYTVTGSTTLSGSTFLQGLSTTYYPDIVTIDPTTGQLFYTSSLSLPLSVLTASYALTASYVDLVAGPNIQITHVGDTYTITSSAGFPNGNDQEVQFQFENKNKKFYKVHTSNIDWIS